LKEKKQMPFINVKVIEGVFSSAQKEAIVKELSEAMVRIEGENMRQVTWCVVEEVASGSWGVGGTPLTTEAVKALAAGISTAA
jgi:4-oxalocrotonate tautomerase